MHAPTLAALVASAFLATPPLHAAPPEPSYAGLDLRAEADASELGLPVYPGARRPPAAGDGDGDEKTAVTLALWGGSLGFRVTVLKLLSPDVVPDIADFYRAALARHGEVLDCAAAGRSADAARSQAEDLDWIAGALWGRD